MIFLDGGVAVAAVGVDDDRRGAVEGRGGLGPAHRMDLDLQTRRLREALLQQHRAGVKLVLAGAVTRLAGDEDDFFIGGENAERQGDGGEEREEFEKFHSGGGVEIT